MGILLVYIFASPRTNPGRGVSEANKNINLAAPGSPLRIITLSTLIFLAGLVYTRGWHQPQIPPPPLAAIVTVSSAHLRKSLDLGRDLLELSHTFGFAEFQREYDVIALERRVKPYDKNASESLSATFQTLSEVRPRVQYPLSFVAAELGGTLARIHDLLGQVRWFHDDPEASRRDRGALMSFKAQVTRVFSRVIPSDLEDLERFLRLSSDHCEILNHMGVTALSVLPTLLQPLGLVRPRFGLSAWAWANDPTVQEGIRIYESVKELFEEIEKHCSTLVQAEISFKEYSESEELFRTYEHLSQISLIDMPPLVVLLDTISDPLDELKELTSIAVEEKRRARKSFESF
ncbi:hypothetical protein FRC01_000297 [Tulasnella sp. 417]|nr:hypothetical protein FRC01_000297 [Tulasnella sp. 417]